MSTDLLSGCEAFQNETRPFHFATNLLRRPGEARRGRIRAEIDRFIEAMDLIDEKMRAGRGDGGPIRLGRADLAAFVLNDLRRGHFY